MALVAVAMTAQQPVITFEKTEHDFGKINEGDGRVSVEFVFKNEGAYKVTYKVANPKYPKKVTAKTVTITAVAAPQEESGDQ